MTSLARKSPLIAEPDALRESLQLLLAGMRKHVVIADETSAKAFASSLAGLEERLRSTTDVGRVTRSALLLLEGYARQANQSIGRQRSELAKLVSELTNAMAALPDVERVTEPIVALQNRLASAPPASELEPFRQAINETLAATRADVLGLKQGISDLISSSIARIKHADRESAGAAAAARAGAADQLTGLPTRASAEAEISKLYAQLPDSLLALFVVRRLQLINRKFGFSRGDQMLVRVVQHLARELESCGNLFRWTSSSFLAVAAPDAPVSHLRSKVQQMGLHRLTLTMEWEGRTALVPVSLDSRIISLSDHASADALCQALDATVLD